MPHHSRHNHRFALLRRAHRNLPRRHPPPGCPRCLGHRCPRCGCCECRPCPGGCHSPRNIGQLCTLCLP